MRSLALLWLCAAYLCADAHVFLYHRFDDSRHPGTSISKEQLRKQFEYLKDNGYQVVPLSTITTALAKNETISDKLVALTIDDGYKSFLQNALGIFKEFGYPFSVFVYVEATEKGYSDFMSWDELKSLTEANGTLEFHSYAHPHSAKLDEKSLKADFEKGLELFKKRLGITPEFYTYPYGEYNTQTQKIAESFGFKAIFNQNSGAINAKSSIYDLDRSALTGNSNIKRLLSQKRLDAQWIEPSDFPSNGVLAKVNAKFDTSAQKAQLYITNIGWREVNLTQGVLDAQINAPLSNPRTRVIVKIGDKVSTKILAKE